MDELPLRAEPSAEGGAWSGIITSRCTWERPIAACHEITTVMTEDAYDVIVVGSGAAGLTAATVAASQGRRTLLVEHAQVIGGTTVG
jgi:heterodisulfide reductase subunit A-like polyferredoxin